MQVSKPKCIQNIELIDRWWMIFGDADKWHILLQFSQLEYTAEEIQTGMSANFESAYELA